MSGDIARHFGGLRDGLRDARSSAYDPKLERLNVAVKNGGKAHVCLIGGTRPEIIKLAPVYHALKAGPATISFLLTGQHRSMADQALAAFEITPDIILGGLEGVNTLTEIQARMLTSVSNALARLKPDMVLVQGDTSSAFAGALAAFNNEIPVGHIESGLSSGKRYDPYPEEMLRSLIREIADYHFAPTEGALDNLKRAGVTSALLTGNTVVDAVSGIAATHPQAPEVIADLGEGAKIVLVTTHRREAWGPGIENISRSVKRLAQEFPDHTFVWPVHLNPKVAGTVRKIIGGTPGVRLTDPLSYIDLTGVMARSTLVMTDSGGIQEEAPSFGVPVLVMRDVTERPEAIDAGLALLVGKLGDGIYTAAHHLLSDKAARDAMSGRENPFGDGFAGPRIADIVEEVLGISRAVSAAQ